MGQTVLKGRLLRNTHCVTTQRSKYLVYSATMAWNLAFPGDGHRKCSTCLTNVLACCYWKQTLAGTCCGMADIHRKPGGRTSRYVAQEWRYEDQNFNPTLAHNVPSSMVSYAVYPLMPDYSSILRSVFTWHHLRSTAACTVIPRLTKIIRSGITFVSWNFSLSRT